ncbi:hypothetical protein LZ32DRAFT_293789 [Colletotrichum eremochloae]|nr:hypothetical protein LZ32DRAFT_293789 [Colletotrichum eremochloae]
MAWHSIAWEGREERYETRVKARALRSKILLSREKKCVIHSLTHRSSPGVDQAITRSPHQITESPHPSRDLTGVWNHPCRVGVGVGVPGTSLTCVKSALGCFPHLSCYLAPGFRPAPPPLPSALRGIGRQVRSARKDYPTIFPSTKFTISRAPFHHLPSVSSLLLSLFSCH